jgi:hypothetical protein
VGVTATQDPKDPQQIAAELEMFLVKLRALQREVASEARRDPAVRHDPAIRRAAAKLRDASVHGDRAMRHFRGESEADHQLRKIASADANLRWRSTSSARARASHSTQPGHRRRASTGTSTSSSDPPTVTILQTT